MAIVFGLSFGLVFGVAFNSIGAIKRDGLANVTLASFTGVLIGLLVGSVTGIFGGYEAGMLVGLIGGPALVHSLPDRKSVRGKTQAISVEQKAR